MKIIKTFGIFALLPLLGGCEKELDFHYHNVEPQLVIQGETTDEGTRVGLTFTTPMDEPTDTSRLRDARVQLSDLTLGRDYELKPDSAGFYTHDIAGIPGHEYELNVERDGKRYSSRCRMRQKVEIVGMEFEWIKMPYDEVACLKISYKDFPTVGDKYWVRVYRNGEIYSWSEMQDWNAKDGVIDLVMMTTRKNPDDPDDERTFKEGDEISVRICAISDEMFDYLMGLENDSNSLRMYEGDFCLGFYLASPVATASIIYRPDSI